MNFLQLLRKQKGKVPHQRGSEKMCDVCDTTLWHWSKKNYLKACKGRQQGQIPPIRHSENLRWT